MSIRYWLVVHPLDRARVLVEGGFVQVPWGHRDPIAAMQPADGVALYCPRERNPDGEPLRAFVQAGRVAAGDPYQPGGRGASPWRRSVEWMRESRLAPIRPLRDLLEFTGSRYWGEQLRDGWMEISKRDFMIAEDAVRRPVPEPSAFALRALRDTGLTTSGLMGTGTGAGTDTGMASSSTSSGASLARPERADPDNDGAGGWGSAF